MKSVSEQSQHRDVSWALLLTVTAIIVGALRQLSYNVIYTEGEVMQSFFTGLIFITAGFALLGLYRRWVALWCVVLFGGTLLLWQTSQLRTWAKLHEEVIAIIKFAEESKSEFGSYPDSLDQYHFTHDWVRSHIYRVGRNEAGEFGITYFMNDPGITYWYSSKSGFGYYPD